MTLKSSEKTLNDRKEERDPYNNQERCGIRNCCIDTGLGLFHEGFMAGASKLGSLSRISSRGFTGAQEISRESHTSEFAGVDSSGVVAAWSWSRPGMDLLSGNADIKSVLNIDLIDIAPSNRDLIDGISNGYSLIEEDNLGMDEEPITHYADGDGPKNTCDPIFTIGIKDGLSGQQERANNHYASEEKTTSRTEDLCICHVIGHVIGHAEIFSWKVA